MNPTRSNVKYVKAERLVVSCSSCGTDISGNAININKSMAQCPKCQEVMVLKDDGIFHASSDASAAVAISPSRPERFMPKGVDVLSFPDMIDIQIDWLKSTNRASLGILTFFAAIWNAIVFTFVITMVASGQIGSLVFLSVHLLVGVGLLYHLARQYFNYTDIIITSQYIEVSERPIKNPFSRTKTYRSDDIEQLYVTRYTASTTNGNPNYAFALHARLTDGSIVKLLKGMNQSTQLYLEQEIEKFLDIKDRYEAGQVG